MLDLYWCSSIVFLTVLGPWGPPEAGLWPHRWLVVPGISALWDALWTCKWNLWLFAAFCESPYFIHVILTFDFFFLTATILQPQHSRNVQQHPAQGSGAQAQCVKCRQGTAGGASAEGPHPEAGSERRLCKHKSHRTVRDLCPFFAIRLIIKLLSPSSSNSSTIPSSLPSTGTTWWPKRSHHHSFPQWYVRI